MTVKFLLDTNVISEPLRPQPDPTVLMKLRAHQDEIGISAIVWHELLYGCYRLPESERKTSIETYLYEVVAVSMPILPYDDRSAHWHSLERSRLTSIGKTPSFVDGQIAAIAGTNNMVLVTFNSSDFQHFRELQIEDWSS